MRASMRDVRLEVCEACRGNERTPSVQFVVCCVLWMKIVYRRSGANLYVAKSHSAFGGKASDSLGISSASVITAGGGAGT